MPSNDHLLLEDNTPPAYYNHIKSVLHTEAVTKAIQNQSPNRIHNRKPPQVAAEKITLSRNYRNTLSQHCSGHCKPLKGYSTDIGLSNEPTCPSCGGGSHDPLNPFISLSHPNHDLCLFGLVGKAFQGRKLFFRLFLPAILLSYSSNHINFEQPGVSQPLLSPLFTSKRVVPL